MDLNRVMLIGRLTRNPEVKAIDDAGRKVANFGLATNRRWRDKENVLHEDVCFVDVEAYGKPVDVIQAYLAKGRSIFVDGHLRYSTWKGENGEKRSKVSVVLDHFSFLPDGRGPKPETTAAQAPAIAQAPLEPPAPRPAWGPPMASIASPSHFATALAVPGDASDPTATF